jgi:hypothetical protein
MTDTKARIEITVPGVKEKFVDWIANRGGVAVWTNINLSNCDAGDQYTPATNTEGKNILDDPQAFKPHWSVSFKEIVTDITRFRFVKEYKEVKRFRVAIRPAFLSFKVSDGGTRKIRKMCAKYSNDQVKAVYRFDYSTQEAVIELPVWED